MTSIGQEYMTLKMSGRLMQVKSIEECSGRAFCNTFDLPVLKTYFGVFWVIP